MNGVRVKARSGDTGTIKDVTYQDITISGITEYVSSLLISRATPLSSPAVTDPRKLTEMEFFFS